MEILYTLLGIPLGMLLEHEFQLYSKILKYLF